MKTSFALSFAVATLLIGPVVAIAAEDSDADRSHPVTFVKDSDITVKIKAELAAKHLNSLGNIHVDTDNAGVVYLTGSAHTQGAIDQAVAIAKGTERVTAVHSKLIVKKDD